MVIFVADEKVRKKMSETRLIVEAEVLIGFDAWRMDTITLLSSWFDIKGDGCMWFICNFVCGCARILVQ